MNKDPNSPTVSKKSRLSMKRVSFNQQKTVKEFKSEQQESKTLWNNTCNDLNLSTPLEIDIDTSNENPQNKFLPQHDLSDSDILTTSKMGSSCINLNMASADLNLQNRPCDSTNWGSSNMEMTMKLNRTKLVTIFSHNEEKLLKKKSNLMVKYRNFIPFPMQILV